MKPLQYYKKQIFIMGCLGMFPMLVFAQETLSSANGLHGDYSGSRVERSADGDKLDIEFSIGLVEKLKSQQMMYISPRFVSVDGKKSVELEPVCISGRRRYKVVKRRKTLHNVKSDQLGYGEVHSVKELKETPLTFKSSFPFESWMADGHLVVDEKLYGCAECGMSKNDGIALQAGIPLFGAKDYAYDFIEPEKVLVKCYKDSFDCKVAFPVARHDLQEQFAGNAQELDVVANEDQSVIVSKDVGDDERRDGETSRVPGGLHRGSLGDGGTGVGSQRNGRGDVCDDTEVEAEHVGSHQVETHAGGKDRRAGGGHDDVVRGGGNAHAEHDAAV